MATYYCTFFGIAKELNDQDRYHHRIFIEARSIQGAYEKISTDYYNTSLHCIEAWRDNKGQI